MGIPIDVAGASPSGLAPFLPVSDRAFLPQLARGYGLLGQSSARLRRLGAGGVLRFGDRRVRIAGVVPDADIGAHELFVSTDEAARLGVKTELYMLVEPAATVSWRAIAAGIRSLLPRRIPMRIRGPGAAAYLRQADAVLPPVVMKSVFGEFAAVPRPRPGGWITIEPSWVAHHILTAWVPILGTVSCNRVLVAQLRGALAELVRIHLAGLIHVDQFAGCFAARLIPGSPGPSVSHHAWGAALDLNTAMNPLGGAPHQDRRLVRVFERWGFTWGGRWLVPDGMHFEFRCFPPALAAHRHPVCARSV